MKLNVLYACDDNYAPYAGVSICSLLENNKEIDEITIYVVSENISNNNITLLHKQVEKYGNKRELKIVDGQQFSKQLELYDKIRYRGSFATYYRIFVEMIIDNDVERLLYLDCDTLIVGDLRSLLLLNFNNKTIAVVLIPTGEKNVITELNNKPYFNAGVILYNILSWKKNNYTAKLIDSLKNERVNYSDVDQAWLNKMLTNDFIVLPLKYNMGPHGLVYNYKTLFKCYPSKFFYTTDEFEDARKNPVILHTLRFLGQFPWHKNSLHPSKKTFDEYLKKSEWNGLEKTKNVGFLFSLERIIYLITPKWLFLRLFSLFEKVYLKHRGAKLLE